VDQERSFFIFCVIQERYLHPLWDSKEVFMLKNVENRIMINQKQDRDMDKRDDQVELFL